MRVAVIGAGISGISAAHHLQGVCDVDLIDSQDRIGGHAHPFQIDENNYVDTGFIVFNNKNYPGLTKFFDDLKVSSYETNMSFGFQDLRKSFAYAGTGLNGLFCQRRNIFKPGYFNFLLEVKRVSGLLEKLEGDRKYSLEEFFSESKASSDVVRDYFLPLSAAIWSAPPDKILDFSVGSFASFLRNHGLLSFKDRPKWRTVEGSSRSYLSKFAKQFAGRIMLNEEVSAVSREQSSVKVSSNGLDQNYDAVILATHADDTKSIFKNSVPGDNAILENWGYQRNEAVLHTDSSLLPRLSRYRASWNFLRTDDSKPVFVNYYMNMLQNLGRETDYIVSLNPTMEIAPSKVLRRVTYRHPEFNLRSVASQEHWRESCGSDGVYFAGAWSGFGFHEDGFQSGLRAAKQLRKDFAF